MNPKPETETISRKIQQAMIDWNPSPLIPKSFQRPVSSAAMNEAIADIAALARAPLEDTIRRQQEQIEHLLTQVRQLEQAMKDIS